MAVVGLAGLAAGRLLGVDWRPPGAWPPLAGVSKWCCALSVWGDWGSAMCASPAHLAQKSPCKRALPAAAAPLPPATAGAPAPGAAASLRAVHVLAPQIRLQPQLQQGGARHTTTRVQASSAIAASPRRRWAAHAARAPASAHCHGPLLQSTGETLNCSRCPAPGALPRPPGLAQDQGRRALVAGIQAPRAAPRSPSPARAPPPPPPAAAAPPPPSTPLPCVAPPCRRA